MIEHPSTAAFWNRLWIYTFASSSPFCHTWDDQGSIRMFNNRQPCILGTYCKHEHICYEASCKSTTQRRFLIISRETHYLAEPSVSCPSLQGDSFTLGLPVRNYFVLTHQVSGIPGYLSCPSWLPIREHSPLIHVLTAFYLTSPILN